MGSSIHDEAILTHPDHNCNRAPAAASPAIWAAWSWARVEVGARVRVRVRTEIRLTVGVKARAKALDRGHNQAYSNF